MKYVSLGIFIKSLLNFLRVIRIMEENVLGFLANVRLLKMVRGFSFISLFDVSKAMHAKLL